MSLFLILSLTNKLHKSHPYLVMVFIILVSKILKKELQHKQPTPRNKNQ
uniref:Uncharacterized protein n=1 Tax=Anguilla anguilla TaxID=7936 RepID=A0A0E9XG68_ANGAN